MAWATTLSSENRLTETGRLVTSWRGVGDGAKIDEEVLAGYHAQLDRLEESSDQICVVLCANDLPADLLSNGGWGTRAAADRFADYAGAVAASIGHRVDQWITLSRPLAALDSMYRRNGETLVESASAGMLDAAHHMLLAHGMAVRILHAHSPFAEVGIELDFETLVPTDEGRDIAGAWTTNWFPHALAHGRYPASAVESFDWDQAVVRDGDAMFLRRHVDFVAVHSPNRAGEMIDRLASDYGFDRFTVSPATSAVFAAPDAAIAV